jgi:hypothetical protein
MKRDALRRNTNLDSSEGMWTGATTYMPFDVQPSTPFFVPSLIPIDFSEASRLFKAFDDDLSASLDRDEMTHILHALGMSETDSIAVLEMMFETTDEVNQEMFRLWLKRHDFIQRPVGFKEKIFLTLSDATLSRAGGYCAMVIVAFIFASVITYMLESLPSLREPPPNCFGCEPVLAPASASFFMWTERIVIGVFTVDYLLRVFTAHAARSFKFKEPNVIAYYLNMDVVYDTNALTRQKIAVHQALKGGPLRKTMNFCLQTLNLVDLFSILPFFLEGLLSGGDGLLVLRILRLCRLFRLFKLKKYSAGFDVFLSTLVQSSEAITVLLFILVLLLVFLGSLVFLAEGGSWYSPNDDCLDIPCSDFFHENGYSPEGEYLRATRDGGLEATPFKSVFDSCWFIMTTITTVGYGDMYPLTDFGRFLAMVCMVLGILAMAMPITVLGSNFQTQFDEEKRRTYVNNRDILKALELGLLGQGDSLQPEDKAAADLTTYEYQKLTKVQIDLADKSGAQGVYTDESLVHCTPYHTPYYTPYLIHHTTHHSTVSSHAHIQRQKAHLVRLESDMKDLDKKVDLILGALSIANPDIKHATNEGHRLDRLESKAKLPTLAGALLA